MAISRLSGQNPDGPPCCCLLCTAWIEWKRKQRAKDGRKFLSSWICSPLPCNECTLRKLGLLSETRKIGADLSQRFSPHRMFASPSRACNILPCIRTYFWLKGAAAPRVSYLSLSRESTAGRSSQDAVVSSSIRIVRPSGCLLSTVGQCPKEFLCSPAHRDRRDRPCHVTHYAVLGRDA